MTSIPHRLLIAGTAAGVGKSLVARAIAAAHPQLCWQTFALTPPLDLSATWRSLQATPGDRLLLDAAGSLGTPITFETCLADLAWDWRLPTLLVTAPSPHCLGDLAAHAALAQQRRCPILGMVLNCCSAEAEAQVMDWANPQQIAALTQLPLLGKLPYLSQPQEAEQLAAAGAEIDWSLARALSVS